MASLKMLYVIMPQCVIYQNTCLKYYSSSPLYSPNLKSNDHKSILDYVIKMSDLCLSCSPSSSLIITGDINNFKIKDLEAQRNCINIVKDPTRHKSIIVCILVQLDILHIYPTCSVGAPINNSDHRIIISHPCKAYNVHEVPTKNTFEFTDY